MNFDDSVSFEFDVVVDDEEVDISVNDDVDKNVNKDEDSFIKSLLLVKIVRVFWDLKNRTHVCYCSGSFLTFLSSIGPVILWRSEGVEIFFQVGRDCFRH